MNGTSSEYWERSTWSCSSVEYRQLTNSVCSSFLSQSWLAGSKQTLQSTDNNRTTTTVVHLATMADCGLETTEMALKILLGYSSLVSSACAAVFPSVLCRYFYRPCSGDISSHSWAAVSSEECLSLKEDVCQNEYQLFQEIVDSGDVCLSFPGCASLRSAASHQPVRSRPVSLWVASLVM